MVYYFTSSTTNPHATIYVGKDKFESLPLTFPNPPDLANTSEDEELIKHGWDEDFHADNLSSAHVYLRLQEGWEWDKLPAALVEDCVQLTKANSIEGNKKDNVTVIYTPWSNLHKNAGMATGQVGFHEAKKTRKILIPTRLNPTINRLSKTRSVTDTTEHLPAEKEAHLQSLRKVINEAKNKERKAEEKVRKEQREEKWTREHAYEELHGGLGEDGEGQGGNNAGMEDEEDFM